MGYQFDFIGAGLYQHRLDEGVKYRVRSCAPVDAVPVEGKNLVWAPTGSFKPAGMLLPVIARAQEAVNEHYGVMG